MSEKGTSLAQYVEHFGLEILNHGDTYETDKVESTNVNRPDLQILGLFDYFDARRIQVMGKAELTYIMKMSENRRTKVFDDLFSYTIPALVLARNMECPAECLQCARNHGRTLLRTTERTADFTSHTMEYLSKELKEERPYYDNFFSQKEDYVTPLTVMHHMDNNHRTLKRNDDKFYMLTINPSGEEQQHLIEKVTGEKTGEFPELSPEQQKEVLAEMKRLTRECMDEYARNFYREKIRSGDDLVWYGRVETERHYKGDDPEVKAGKAKAGERKPGLQLHVHIIVSRMDRSQTVSLSPLSKSRGNRQVLDGRDVVVGFDRSQWSARCASRFNRLYGYFPYCRSKDEGLKEYSGEWKVRNELRNETVSRIKREILHGEFREERRLYMNVCRLYRFVVNPRKAIIQELKRLGTDLLTGRER